MKYNKKIRNSVWEGNISPRILKKEEMKRKEKKSNIFTVNILKIIWVGFNNFSQKNMKGNVWKHCENHDKSKVWFVFWFLKYPWLSLYPEKEVNSNLVIYTGLFIHCTPEPCTCNPYQGPPITIRMGIRKFCGKDSILSSFDLLFIYLYGWKKIGISSWWMHRPRFKG